MKQIIIDGKPYNLVPANELIINDLEIESPVLYVGAESTDGMFVFSALLNEDSDVVDKNTASIEYKSDGDSEVDYWDNSNFLRNLQENVSYTEFLPKDFKPEQRAVLQKLLNTVHEKGWL